MPGPPPARDRGRQEDRDGNQMAKTIETTAGKRLTYKQPINRLA